MSFIFSKKEELLLFNLNFIIYFRNFVQQREHENIGATELILSNGMHVSYKCTDFFNDQVNFLGFSIPGSIGS